MLQLSPSTETIQQAYRWYNLFNLSLSIDLSDVVPASDCTEYFQYKLPRNAKFMEDAIVGGESVLRRNLTLLKNEQHDDSEIEERTALQRQCRRFIHFFCTGEDNQGVANRLRLIDGAEQKESELKLKNNQRDSHDIYARGPRISYFYNDQKFERFSPLVSRLIAIAFETAPQASNQVHSVSIQSEHEIDQRNRRSA
ncbi:MAG: hypothetical protein P8M53_06555 [Pirellulales bacterium]|nr:hypothetical protein [Pirellulales bacterium]